MHTCISDEEDEAYYRPMTPIQEEERRSRMGSCVSKTVDHEDHFEWDATNSDFLIPQDRSFHTKTSPAKRVSPVRTPSSLLAGVSPVAKGSPIVTPATNGKNSAKERKAGALSITTNYPSPPENAAATGVVFPVARGVRGGTPVTPASGVREVRTPRSVSREGMCLFVSICVRVSVYVHMCITHAQCTYAYTFVSHFFLFLRKNRCVACDTTRTHASAYTFAHTLNFA